MTITFRPLVEADLPLVARWMARPHVSRVWSGDTSPESLRRRYLPRLEPDSPVQPHLASVGDAPVGYIQSYVAADVCGGWWPEETDPGTRGIDFFLADGERQGRGLGTAMVRSFVDRLFADEEVTRIQADPDPGNTRSVRCLEKVGFTNAGRVTTPDGPAALMVLERRDWAGRRKPDDAMAGSGLEGVAP